MRPSSANFSSGILFRSSPLDSSASRAESCSPASIASKIALPRSPQSIGRYRCQLNVGNLQHLLNAIRNPVDLLYQTHAIPREVSEFPCWLRGHETPAQQSVLQQVRDPLAVFLVRLPTGHRFDVLR